MAQTERRFKEQPRTKENVRARANMRGGDYDSYVKGDVKIYKVREGKNLIRILPPTWDNAAHYGFDVWLNFGIGVDNQSYLSLKKMKGEADPIDEARREAEREGDKKLAKALAPKQRVGVWLIDRLAEEDGPQFWAIPFTVDRDFNNLSMDEDTKDVLVIDKVKTGCDVRFYAEGQGRNRKYPSSKMKIMESSRLHEDQDTEADWLEYITDHPIPEVLNYYTYDEISQAFGGHARVDRDDDSDDDDKPRGKRAGNGRDDDEDERPRGRRAAARDDDDEDVKPKTRRVVSDEDDAEEVKPRRQRTRVPDEDEADEKPRGRSARRPADDDADDAVSDTDDDADSKRGKDNKSASERIREKIRGSGAKTRKRDEDDDADPEED